MKRIIFCAQIKFPKGGAGTNRVLYLAKAMKAFGFDVTVVSPDLSGSKKNGDESMVYSGINCVYFRRFGGKFGKIFNFFGGSAKNTISALKKLNVSKDDTVVIYSSVFFYINALIRFLNRRKISTFIDVVEHHQEFQYDSSIVWFNYRNAFKISAKTGKVIAISKHINDYFEAKGCIAPILPVFTDKEDYEAVVKTKMDKTIFIYPGNAHKKDDMKTMISAFASLSDEQKKRVEFHVTSTKDDTMRKILGDDYEELTEKTKGCVFVHLWLKYDELIDLYKKAQFLLLARPDNIVTQANFPSKVPELTVTGIIPIISKVGDIVNYLTDGVDSIFMDNPTTVDVCRQAIIKAMELSDEEIRNMSLNARKTAEEKFDYRNWVETVGKIFG